MNRRDFLKAIGAAAVTASVSSKAIAAVLEKEAAIVFNTFDDISSASITPVGNGWNRLVIGGTSKKDTVSLSVKDGHAAEIDTVKVTAGKEYQFSCFVKAAEAKTLQAGDITFDLEAAEVIDNRAPDGSRALGYMWGPQLSRADLGGSNLIRNSLGFKSS